MSRFVSLADRPIELAVDPHWSNLCASVTSSTQHQSESFALILLKEDQFVQKHLDSDNKKFFQSALRDWLPRDDDKPSAAVSHTWGDTNVSVSQAGQDGALINSTCVRDSCSGELHIKVCHKLFHLGMEYKCISVCIIHLNLWVHSSMIQGRV